MNPSKATKKMEQDLLLLIAAEEKRLKDGQIDTPSAHYFLCLADVYRENNRISDEVNILERFAALGSASTEDTNKIFKRILKVYELRESLKHKASASNTENFSMQALEKDIMSVENIQPELGIKNYEICLAVAVCAAYTGATADDEIFELSLSQFEYCKNNDILLRITKQYHGLRRTQGEIPERKKRRFSVNKAELEKSQLDRKAILDIILGSEQVISHNHPYIERQHLVLMFPELAKIPWHSSQVDIPWKALQMDTISLTQLLKQHGNTLPVKSTSQRARGIVTLLSQIEPGTKKSYMARLMKCKPMRAFVWTPELKKASKRLNKRKFIFWR